MRVFLIGFMGSGKTTAGENLAKKTGLPFIDLDAYIEKKHNTTIRLIMYEQGEDKFREYEHLALTEVIENNENVVISTGGGVPCYHNNIDLMNKSGITIYIELDIPILVSRLLNSKTDRPLVWGKSKEDLMIYTKELLSKRQEFYKQAQFTVEGKDLKVETLKEIVDSHSD